LDAKLAVYGDGVPAVTDYLKNRFGFMVLDSLEPITEEAYAYLGFNPSFPLCLIGNYYADIRNLIPYGNCGKDDFLQAYKMLQTASDKSKHLVELLALFITTQVSYSSVVLAGPLCAAEKDYLRENGFELVSAGDTVLSKKHLFTGKSAAYLHAQILSLDIFKPDL
jgi:hypothetical protein